MRSVARIQAAIVDARAPSASRAEGINATGLLRVGLVKVGNARVVNVDWHPGARLASHEDGDVRRLETSQARGLAGREGPNQHVLDPETGILEVNGNAVKSLGGADHQRGTSRSKSSKDCFPQMQIRQDIPVRTQNCVGRVAKHRTDRLRFHRGQD